MTCDTNVFSKLQPNDRKGVPGPYLGSNAVLVSFRDVRQFYYEGWIVSVLYPFLCKLLDGPNSAVELYMKKCGVMHLPFVYDASEKKTPLHLDFVVSLQSLRPQPSSHLCPSQHSQGIP